MDGDMIQILQNGVPTSVRIYNTPLTHREDVESGSGLVPSGFLAHEPALELESGHPLRSYGDEHSGAGRARRILAVPARIASRPRTASSTGTRGRRALDSPGTCSAIRRPPLRAASASTTCWKASSLAQNVNPNFIAFSTCPWTSLTPPTPGQALTGCTGFSGNNNHIDPNMKRPYQWEYTVMVQRQIGANTSVSVGYYGRKFSICSAIVNAGRAADRLYAGDHHESADRPDR